MIFRSLQRTVKAFELSPWYLNYCSGEGTTLKYHTEMEDSGKTRSRVMYVIHNEDSR